MYKYILFDLDGTLTDSKEGIFNCIKYCLDKLKKPMPDLDTLYQFIGPPMVDSFMKYCGMERSEAEDALLIYRERYGTVGLFENAPVDGAAELLERLKKKGYVMAIASSKPERYVVPIADKFGFSPWLDAIAGSENGLNEEKSDVIEKVFSRLGITDREKPETLMVGDRFYDVEGAEKCGIKCLGVRFLPYAPEGELEKAGAVAVFDTIAESERYIETH